MTQRSIHDRGPRVNGGGVPGPEQKRWVVVVLDWDKPLYVVDAKSGGAASTLDEATWADRSRAHNFVGMMRHRGCLDGDRPLDELHPLRVAYVDEGGTLRFADGEPVSKGAT